MPSLKLPLAAALLAAFAYVFCTQLSLQGLPDYVATHFDTSGRATGLMPRGELLRFDLLLGLGGQVFISAMCWVQRFLPRAALNVPNRNYWRRPENFRRACDILLRHSIWLGAVMQLWLILLNWQVRQANLAMPPHLDTQPFIVAMATFAVMFIIWAVTLVRKYRVPGKR